MVQEREPGWRGDELAHWPDLSVQPGLLPSCTAPSPLPFFFFFFKRNIQSPTWAENCRAFHRNGLGPFEKDVKLIVGQSVGELWRRDPVACVPLCLLYLTAELRRSVVSGLGIAPHRQKCLSLRPCALKADACCDLLTV